LTQNRRAESVIALSQLFNYSLPLLTFPLLVKSLDVELYGIWVEAGTLVGLLSIFVSSGLGNAMTALVLSQYKDDPDAVYSNALYLFVGICGSLALLCLAAAPVLNALTIRIPLGIEVIRTVSFLVLIASLNALANQVFRARRMNIAVATFDILLGLGKLGAVIFATIHHDLALFAQVYVGLQGCITLVQMAFAFRGIRLKVISRPILAHVLRIGANLGLVSQTNWLVMFGDRLLLSLLSTSIAVAIYSASYQLTLILSAFSVPFLYTLLPTLGQFWQQGDIASAQAVIRRTTRILFVILVPAVIGLGLTGDALLGILATEDFVRGGLLVAIIATGIAVDSLGTALQYLFYVQNRTQVLREIFIRASVFNIILNLICIPLFSYYGAGLTTLLTYILIAVMLSRRIAMPLTTLFDFSVLRRCLVASAVMGLWVLATIQPSIPRLLIAVLGGAVIYGLGLVALRIVTVAQLRDQVGFVFSPITAQFLRKSGR
jgi:O-antigen/teichoic acid export membrane protein